MDIVFRLVAYIRRWLVHRFCSVSFEALLVLRSQEPCFLFVAVAGSEHHPAAYGGFAYAEHFWKNRFRCD